MKYDTQIIVNAIQAAFVAAEQVGNENLDDSQGECNFDSAYIKVPGMRNTQRLEILAAIPHEDNTRGIELLRKGLSTCSMKSIQFRVVYGVQAIVIEYSWGQGSLRKRMARAAEHSLESSGLSVGYEHVVD